MKTRLSYMGLALFSFILGLLIVVFFSNYYFIRGVLGDLLIVVFTYSLIKSFYQVDSKLLSFIVILTFFMVEGFQYLNLIKYIGLSENKIAKIVLGATFDPIDLLFYLLGGLLVYYIDIKLIDSEQKKINNI
ncbi:uncharacterized protein DUF2809 [Orenia metallireducens]|uniref:ribosomal maturation YjgA family protein n=1 Tax=Orenia metallireducens TaxID=1413210 RepID=UPI000D0762F9|nr:DUF2809 domain-containing protein [Orenia metallireducens]PRX34846.1 uncharacterized protein DUF2809 [Orenia metallireducens]